MPYALGIDIGGTNVKMVSVSADGTVADKTTFETDDVPNVGKGGGQGAAAPWAEHVRRQVEQYQQPHGPAEAIGLCAPGLAAADHRSIWWMKGRLDAVMGLDWTELLRPPRPVRVLNDAHAALRGEAWQGAAKGCRDAVLLTLGTGVGGAIICDGKLLRGRIGRAGHLGHLCLDPEGKPDIVGTPGTLEDAIGDWTVPARTHGRFTHTKELVDAHLAGDASASRVWLRSVQWLACGLVSIINAVDPEVVILGGGVSRAGEALFGPLREYLDKVEWRPHGHAVRVVPAALGEWAGALGVAHFAMEEERAAPRKA